jgi:hypothetical protein
MNLSRLKNCYCVPWRNEKGELRNCVFSRGGIGPFPANGELGKKVAERFRQLAAMDPDDQHLVLTPAEQLALVKAEDHTLDKYRELLREGWAIEDRADLAQQRRDDVTTAREMLAARLRRCEYSLRAHCFGFDLADRCRAAVLNGDVPTIEDLNGEIDRAEQSLRLMRDGLVNFC